jgi:hypothetical protein
MYFIKKQLEGNERFIKPTPLLPKRKAFSKFPDSAISLVLQLRILADSNQ